MATDSTRLKVRLVGADDEGAVFLSEFRHFCDGLEACLKRAEKLATGQSGRVAYRLAALEGGSAQITLEAVQRGKGRDNRVAVLRLFRKTVKALQSGTRLDGGSLDLGEVTRLFVEGLRKRLFRFHLWPPVDGRERLRQSAAIGPIDAACAKITYPTLWCHYSTERILRLRLQNASGQATRFQTIRDAAD